MISPLLGQVALIASLRSTALCWEQQHNCWEGHINISDVTWAALAMRNSQEQLTKVIFLADFYQTMAMITTSIDAELEAPNSDFEDINSLRSCT